MRVIYNTASSINGYIADEQHSLQWLFDVPGDAGSSFDQFLEGVGALVMGSSTYEWVLAHERVLEDPEKWSEFYPGRRTFVFSNREQVVPQGADITIVGGRVADHIEEFERACGDRDLWIVGGGDLAGQFADAGLLDEIRLSLAPVTLSGGAPGLPRTIASDRLHLVSARQAGPFAELVYRCRAEAPAGSGGSD